MGTRQNESLCPDGTRSSFLSEKNKYRKALEDQNRGLLKPFLVKLFTNTTMLLVAIWLWLRPEPNISIDKKQIEDN